MISNIENLLEKFKLISGLIYIQKCNETYQEKTCPKLDLNKLTKLHDSAYLTRSLFNNSTVVP